METEIILRRVHELELEVQKLKAQVAKSPRRQVQVVVKKSVGFVLTYWTLLSFVVAIGVAIYIKYAFNVDYFENYRSLAANRATAEFHNKLGNDLLRRQEWNAAEEAFTRALAANAHNSEAGFGLLKSRIFKPAAGEKFTSPRTQDTMLAFLREHRPEDVDLDLIQAARYWEQDQKEDARKSLEAALARQPDFAPAQAMLGHIEMVAGNLPAAREWCEKAVANDPGDPTVQGNLGFILMMTNDLEKALERLERSSRIVPHLLTHLVISDVLRLQGKFSEALTYSRHATKSVQRPDLGESRYAGGEWFYNHLPLHKDDREAWQLGIFASQTDRKKSLAHFAHALDLALTGDVTAAEKMWSRAMEFEPDESLRPYWANKIKATLVRANPPADAPGTAWLLQKLTGLEPAAEGP